MSFVDPLWEFVLEDYEEEDNGWGRRRSNRKKKEAARNEGSYFNFFGGDSDQKKSRKAYQSDDRNDADVSGRRELSKVNLTRNDSRGSASSWGRKSKISSSKSSKKYSNDGKDGFWDVITGAPPAATIQKNNARKSSPNKNSKNRVLRKKNASESIKRSQSNVLGNSQPKPLVRTSSTKSEKSKSGFKKRFRRNQSTKSSEKNRVSKPEVKQTIPNKPPQSAKLPDDDGFYPIDFFHHIADSLDPWIVDSSVASSSEESSITIDDDEDTRSYTSSQVQNEDGVVAKSESRSSVRARDEKSNYKLESLLDQPLPDSKSAKPKGNTHHQKQSTKEETGVTEIRLRVNPGGNTLSEQVIKANPNLYYSFPEDAQKFLHKDDVSSKSRPSFDASESDNSSVVSRIKQHLKIKPKQPRVVKDRDSRKIAKDSIRPTSKEMKPPTAVHIQKKPEARDDWEDIEHQKKCQLWKRGSCNSERTCKNDSTNLFGKADETEVFPTSRVVKVRSQFLRMTMTAMKIWMSVTRNQIKNRVIVLL
ncbi:unnamed protein product [Pseudo-nitzschia multistriata]|uniref:Uncharacterized protein n=1 Tax=Pseudo-nitzschia multistriata TaxID=183589 RepID=A0A448Z942_9STRA|nr:unnamed protein product [Pseudo-nitzschia multistriata]